MRRQLCPQGGRDALLETFLTVSLCVPCVNCGVLGKKKTELQTISLTQLEEIGILKSDSSTLPSDGSAAAFLPFSPLI
jgi:hypothetical protein